MFALSRAFRSGWNEPWIASVWLPKWAVTEVLLMLLA